MPWRMARKWGSTQLSNTRKQPKAICLRDGRVSSAASRLEVIFANQGWVLRYS